MRKTVTAFFAFIASLSTFALDEEACKREIKFVGGKNNVPIDCFEVAAGGLFTHRILSEVNFEIKAIGKIIFIKDIKNATISRIAGEKTQVHSVLSLEVDKKNGYIYVLNENVGKEKNLLTFKLNWQGNVYPYKTISQEHLPQDVKQVVFDSVADRILALNRQGNKIYSIINGESKHRNEKEHPSVDRTYTVKIPVQYLHVERSGIIMFHEDGKWKKFRSISDKTLLENGDLKGKALKSPASLEKESSANQ